MPSGFPIIHRSRIDTQLRGHLPLRQAEHPACGGKALREGGSGRQRVIPQELNDGRHVADLRDGCVAFPAGNGLFVNPDLVGNLLLEEIEVQAVGAETVA